MPPTPLLQVSNLKTFFRTGEGIARSVDGVSFSIEHGKTLALVGESGCGKSVTALSIIQLIQEPAGYIEAGEINLLGKDLLTLTKKEKQKIRGDRISMIFQEPMTSLNPVFTIGFQIKETIKIHQNKNNAEARELSIALLKKVGIPDPENRFHQYPHQLSGGMKQRVMIAIALSSNPDFLIADEPTTALDVTIQAQILKLIKDLQSELKMGILLITHDLSIVCNTADHVAVMYAGKIVEQSLMKNIFKENKHPYTQALFKSIPSRLHRGKKLLSIEGLVPSPLNFPTGCRFHPRCPKVRPICSQKMPELKEVAPGHSTACFLFP